MGLCVFSLPISLMMTQKIYTLSYYHSQIGSMNYYPLFRVKPWNNGMRCMSLYILMNWCRGIWYVLSAMFQFYLRMCILFLYPVLENKRKWYFYYSSSYGWWDIAGSWDPCPQKIRINVSLMINTRMLAAFFNGKVCNSLGDMTT